jgi:hypothetical protein
MDKIVVKEIKKKVNKEGKQTIENKNTLGIAPNQIVQRAIQKHIEHNLLPFGL